MGLIFAKPWNLFCNQEHKVIIVGLDNSGKTTILYQFLMNKVGHTSPTTGSNVEETVVKNTHFLTWDIGGQESLWSSRNTYYTNTEFIILVVDSIDGERLAITKEELYRMLAHEFSPLWSLCFSKWETLKSIDKYSTIFNHGFGMGNIQESSPRPLKRNGNIGFCSEGVILGCDDGEQQVGPTGYFPRENGNMPALFIIYKT